jgi:murein DD-endopeptidase MepM/ murein hydrolase activator NlpD
MKKFALAAALVLAVTGGTARADVFAIVPAGTGTGTGVPFALPSAETPNTPGLLLLPLTWREQASVQPAISYPELEALWRSAGSAYGIPWEVLAAINKIESNFGRNMGPSSAGAVGWMQFMPDTWLRWGTDGDGDRVADPWDPQDGVYSAARYLAAAGGMADLRRSVFAYNHAEWYVDDVLELAAVFGQGGGETTLTYDTMQQDLGGAQIAIVQASEALTAALKERQRAARIEADLLARVDRQKLFSNRLAAQKRATLAGVEHAAVQRRIEALRDVLAEAEQVLADARARAQGAAFAPAAGSLLGAPSYSGDYVFPVGGGASVVSVGADHHDYPAADIAAPAGSPLYALSNGIVKKAWRYDSRCGIGFTIDTTDGLTWTYCHLAYLEPAVVPGAMLVAGAPVGLVGSSGHSTGPHLHLQLQPATVYPQAQAWFQSFAGTAFQWQGDPPALAAAAVPRSGDVFSEVGEAGSGDGVVFFNR